MVNRKIVYGVMGAFITLVLVSSIASAGIIDSIKKVFSKDEPELAPFEAEIQLANTAPIIDSWTAPDSDSVTAGLQPYRPICQDSGTTTSIGGAPGTSFTVTVSDANGCEDVRGNGVVTVQFSKGGVNRPATPATCTAPPTCTGNTVTFTCNGLIEMQHYDVSASDWAITFTATDGTDPASNSPRVSIGPGDPNYPTFTYGSTLCIELQDDDDPTVPLDTIFWTGVSTSTTDLESGTGVDVSYMRVFNRGNVNLEGVSGQDNLQIKADNLLGVTDPSFGIDETSFGIDERSTANGVPCAGTTCPCNTGAGYSGQLLSTTLGTMLGAALPLATDAGPSLEQLFFCLESVVLPGGQTGLPSQSYRSQSAPNNWEMSACELCA